MVEYRFGGPFKRDIRLRVFRRIRYCAYGGRGVGRGGGRVESRLSRVFDELT